MREPSLLVSRPSPLPRPRPRPQTFAFLPTIILFIFIVIFSSLILEPVVSYPILPSEVGVEPSAVALLSLDSNFLSYDYRSNLLVENKIFYPTDSLINIGDNVTFRNCRFLVNLSALGGPIYYMLNFIGKYGLVDHCEILVNPPNGNSTWTVELAIQGLSHLQVMNSVIIGAEKSIVFNDVPALARNNFVVTSQKQSGEGIVYGGYRDPLSLPSYSVVVEDNSVKSPSEFPNAVMNIYPFNGKASNVIVRRNIFAGGGYTFRSASDFGTTSNIQVYDNIWSTEFFPLSGFYGPAGSFEPYEPGNIWFNNTFDNGTSAEPAYDQPSRPLCASLLFADGGSCLLNIVNNISTDEITFRNTSGTVSQSINVTGSITLSQSTLAVTGPTLLFISGNLSLSNSSQIILEGTLVSGSLTLEGGSAVQLTSPGVSRIETKGCIAFNGTLIISRPSQSQSIVVAKYGCKSGEFGAISLSSEPSECDQETLTPIYNGTSLMVTFDLRKNAKCNDKSLSKEQVLGLAIGIPVAALTLLALILIFAIPSIRRRVLPYRDREKHQFKSKP